MDDAALREEAKDRIEHLDGKMLLYAVTMLEGIEERANIINTRFRSIDWDAYVMPGGRAGHVKEYMEEMRDGDRL